MQHTLLLQLVLIVSALCRFTWGVEPVDFTLRLDIVSQGFNKKSCWVHPRAGLIPGDKPIIVLTAQQAMLSGSDLFGPLHEFRSDDLGKSWLPPLEHSDTLGKRTEPGNVIVVPSDFWPKWHAKSGKLLGIGHNVRYRQNRVIPSGTRARETIYAVYDPAARRWTPWTTLDMPDPDRFFNAGAGSVQRLDLEQGDLLLPIYFAPRGETHSRVVVLRCGFDGQKLVVRDMGNELREPSERGLGEPSLTRFQNRYFLTLRHDKRAYVTTSQDGLHFAPQQVWNWDDGSELGSYNTQTHWVTHTHGLFLVYTRRGVNNDHIPRHRAPLFIAQVDPERLCILRKTERELMPQRGAKLGNFGVLDVSPQETWVTDAEWMQTSGPNFADYTQCMKYGSDNAIFAARILWNTPNTTWNQR